MFPSKSRLGEGDSDEALIVLFGEGSKLNLVGPMSRPRSGEAGESDGDEETPMVLCGYCSTLDLAGAFSSKSRPGEEARDGDEEDSGEGGAGDIP